MHQHNIKRNFLQHHSIPICLARSIPIGCIVALLLLIGSLFVVDLGFGLNDNLVYADTNDSINLQAASSALTIASPSLTASAEPGGTAYAKSNVTYSVSGAAGEISSWSLRVSYASGKSALAYEGTGSGTTMSGAGGAALTDNKWGYAWTASSTAAAPSAYNTMPAYGSPATMTSGTDVRSSTTGAIHFAAKFASNAVPGHYKTKVLLSLVATPKVTYTLTLNANNGSGGPGTQTCTTTADSCSITISNTKPTRDGYDFLGWAGSSDATAKEYDAGGTITMTANKTIYAVWKTKITGLKSITNMQQMTSAVCTASAVGDEATLTDTRDSSTYTVKKLQDGKCWMTQNLRIVNKSISDADSDLQNATTKTYTIPASSTSGFSDNAASNAYYGNNTTYGAYYTWCAATAGTCTSATTNLAEAPGSICPKGWRLPKGTPGTGTNEFANMAGIPTTTNITAGSNFWSNVPTKTFASSTLTLRDSAWPAAGRYNSGSPNYIGSFGFYWSSTANDSTLAYSLRFGSSNFDPANYGSRRYGGSVRCVAE